MLWQLIAIWRYFQGPFTHKASQGSAQNSHVSIHQWASHLESIIVGNVSIFKSLSKETCFTTFSDKRTYSIKALFFSKAKQYACPFYGLLCTLTTSLVTAEPWLCTSAQSEPSTLCLLTFNNGLTDLVDSGEVGDWLLVGIPFNRASGVKLRSNRRDPCASILPAWFTRSHRTLTLT